MIIMYMKYIFVPSYFLTLYRKLVANFALYLYVNNLEMK